ncbi:lamin tail domain-containing protein [Halobacterium jilantaiense]|uniref:lamin tail domain-containing protein n=1 Tax=Halobacterium jilantaiense TaxID=355548 RepID=UPI001C4312D0|nr:lamin tail domain-containing protein [Halobacterium jilantaiense]
MAVFVAALLVTSAGVATAGVAADSPSNVSITDSVTVTVTSVTDGDTVDVEYQNGSTDTVRLLGVDTPEVNGENTPSEYEGVPDTQAGSECLASAGDDASQYTTSALAGETVTLKFDSEADRRGDYGRLLAYVYADGENVNRDLVETGNARVYDSAFSKSETFYDAEADAQDAGDGLWTCQSPDDGGDGETDAVSIDWVYAEADALNDERVKLTNDGDSAVDMSGFVLSDAADHEYAFPDGFTLDPGASVWVHSGSGTDDADDRYAAFGSEVWNDDGDTATLTDADGDTVDERSY